MDARKLSDADIEAIVEVLEKRLKENFYKDLGRGVWSLLWQTVIIILLVIAAYGAVKSSPFDAVMANRR